MKIQYLLALTPFLVWLGWSIFEGDKAIDRSTCFSLLAILGQVMAVLLILGGIGAASYWGLHGLHILD